MSKLIIFIFLMAEMLVSKTWADTVCADCCKFKGGVQYCDSSAGRYVCYDGDYSPCYCTRHAVMNLQKIEGCCLWQGGVLTRDPRNGFVICNDGSVSEPCSIQDPPTHHW